MSQNTAQRPPTTGMGTGASTGMGTGTGTGYGAGTGAHTERRAAYAVGGSFFAGVLMVVMGATAILQGAAAVRRDRILNSVSGYAYGFNLSSWGWLHIALGILVALVGLAILMRIRPARYAGIAVASLILVSQFMYLPYQPVWAVVGMALAAWIIWALATDRGPFGAAPGTGAGGAGTGSTGRT
ncbi:hypothetical protein ACFRR7_20670 [Streptomyces sp. NPDC056909]|uniref:DUF7144 family membrane protein n=1 Tax=unclassified Streptomyces TaxID=2593676 RepID=UPI0034221D77|nr:hypothetical protein OG214_19155 [Streptomyces sp. NBC_00872]